MVGNRGRLGTLLVASALVLSGAACSVPDEGINAEAQYCIDELRKISRETGTPPGDIVGTCNRMAQ